MSSSDVSRGETISFSSCPWEDAIGSFALLTSLEGYWRALQHRPPVLTGWKRNKVVDCPISGITPVCSVCIRYGFDLRRIFCPFPERG